MKDLQNPLSNIISKSHVLTSSIRERVVYSYDFVEVFMGNLLLTMFRSMASMLFINAAAQCYQPHDTQLIYKFISSTFKTAQRAVGVHKNANDFIMSGILHRTPSDLENKPLRNLRQFISASCKGCVKQRHVMCQWKRFFAVCFSVWSQSPFLPGLRIFYTQSLDFWLSSSI